MSFNTPDIATVAIAAIPLFAAAGIESHPVGAGLMGAAIASALKIGPIDIAKYTLAGAISVFGKFIVTFLSGAIATVYGSPWACSRMHADVSLSLLIYLGIGLTGSAIVRLVVSYDRAIASNTWSMLVHVLTGVKPPPPAPPDVPAKPTPPTGV